MKLVYLKYDLKMELQENRVFVLSIENEAVFSEMVCDLWRQTNGEEGGFLLSEDDKIYSLSSMLEFIVNPFSIDCNNRKILSKLYKELQETASSVMQQELGGINTAALQFLEKLEMETPYSLHYRLDMDFHALLKCYDVKLEIAGESFLDKIVNYMKILHQLCGKELVVFLNLKQYLSKKEMQLLYQFAFYEKIYVMIIEGSASALGENEIGLIYDPDLCIIERQDSHSDN